MTSSYDPGGLFSIGDGIGPQTTPGTPPGFDLVEILSESMRSRPVWRDMAHVTSNVLYKYVESMRIALEMSREPDNLARVLKIVTLKMLGLDWNSSNLTDEAYNRLIRSISLYNSGHGPADFVGYIGYALGIPLDMLTLWTTDYGSFHPGPPMIGDTIFDTDRQGVWYPTSHVGLLYEEFAPGASSLDLDALRIIFYKMAPINIVLEWIASEVTLRIGPLVMALGIFETEEATVQVGTDTPCIVDLRLAIFEGDETQDIILIPEHPQTSIPVSFSVIPFESGEDTVVTAKFGIDWLRGNSLIRPDSLPSALVVNSVNEGVITGDGAGAVTLTMQPVVDWRPPWNQSIYGGLVRPHRLEYAYYTNVPQPWTGGTIATAIREFSDGTPCPLVSAPAATPFTVVTTSLLPAGTHVVTWIVHPELNDDSSHPILSLTRGMQTVTWDTAGTTITSSPPGISCGLLPIGTTGFYMMWAYLTGTAIIASTQGGSSSYPGKVSWYNLTVENAAFPSLPTIAAHTVPLDSYSSGWYSLDGKYLKYNHGFILMRATALFPEWQYANQVLLDVVSLLGYRLVVDVDSTGMVGWYTITNTGVVKPRISLSTITAGTQIGIAIKWNAVAGTITFFLNSDSFTYLEPWNANLSSVHFLKPFNSPPTSLWVVGRLLLLGFLSSTSVPSDDVISWMAQNA